MILDYLFFRVYEEYQKYRREGNPFDRSIGYIIVILHLIIFPVGINLSLLYSTHKSIFDAIPYLLLLFVSYRYIHNRYKRNFRKVMRTYENKKMPKIPIIFLWILLPIAGIGSLALMILLDYYVMGPLGLIGIFEFK